MHDDPDPARSAEWDEVAAMVTATSERFRAEILRVVDNWMAIEEPVFRNQGLREMDAILSELQVVVRSKLT